MSGEAIALIELLLVFGFVIGFCVWQLRTLRRPDATKRPDEPPAPKPPEGS